MAERDGSLQGIWTMLEAFSRLHSSNSVTVLIREASQFCWILRFRISRKNVHLSSLPGGTYKTRSSQIYLLIGADRNLARGNPQHTGSAAAKVPAEAVHRRVAVGEMHAPAGEWSVVITSTQLPRVVCSYVEARIHTFSDPFIFFAT